MAEIGHGTTGHYPNPDTLEAPPTGRPAMPERVSANQSPRSSFPPRVTVILGVRHHSSNIKPLLIVTDDSGNAISVPAPIEYRIGIHVIGRTDGLPKSGKPLQEHRPGLRVKFPELPERFRGNDAHWSILREPDGGGGRAVGWSACIIDALDLGREARLL